jgi:hypothetical protein
MALAAAPHPRAVLKELRTSGRTWKATWDAAWTVPAPVIAGKQVTFTLAVGSFPVNTPCYVEWGDGTANTYNITGASLGFSHTYAAAGTYTVRISIGPSIKSTAVTVT